MKFSHSCKGAETDLALMFNFLRVLIFCYWTVHVCARLYFTLFVILTLRTRDTKGLYDGFLDVA